MAASNDSTISKTMKAWQFTNAKGGLDKNLYINHAAPTPSPTAGKILVEVISASINPVDHKLAEIPIINRVIYGWLASPGIDFCGRVAKSNDSDFQEGQRVFGRLDKPNTYGTLAQFTVASKEIAAVPDAIDSDTAAAVGTAGTTAYQCLKLGGAGPGAKVFINGGSGGTGTWGIQFAKAMGSEVTTSCSTRNIELCKSLGADEVIDYTKEDLIAKLKSKGQYFDLVVDNVGLPSPLYKEADHFLKPGSKYMQVGAPMSFASMYNLLIRMSLPSSLGNGSSPFKFHDVYSSRQDLEEIAKLVEGKKAKAVFDKKFEWDDAPEAYTRLKSGKAQGKIVVHVNPESTL
jgi:NADPH:quinone reductase-like Zn-dependent oxidoreductase